MNLPMNQIIGGDALEVVATLPDDSIDCVVTSPPYFGLRDYGVDGQIGLEKTPAEYVGTMVQLFREVRRVLKPTGSLWLNLGDSFANKDLMMIPARVAIALQDDGWILRSEIVWAKPNAMPESVKDRPTKAHEMVYLLTKSPDYYYDWEAIAEPYPQSTIERMRYPVAKIGASTASASPYTTKENTERVLLDLNPVGRNKRTVWEINTRPMPEAHFATFPPDLIEPMIKAGCPVGGIVLDPFMGSGTTALVARALKRNYIGIELNPDYVAIALDRLRLPFEKRTVIQDTSYEHLPLFGNNGRE